MGRSSSVRASWIAVSVFWAALAPPARVDAAQGAESHRLGINAGAGALDWDPAEMFADTMKTFRIVEAPDGSPVARDSRGWPLADCRFLVWHGLTREAGTYRLRFRGSATTILANGSSAPVQNVDYNPSTQTTTADVVLAASNVLYLTFLGTSGGVQEVQLMLPGHAFEEIWNQRFLQAIQPLPILRLMDFTSTNWNQQVHWSDRVTPDLASQQQQPGPPWGWQGKGIAWEYAIHLLNTTDKDGWINIPAMATSDYVQNLIHLIQNGANGFPPLEAERKLYIEYSNEVWNGLFDQAQYNHAQAVAEVGAGGSPLNFDGETNDWYWAWRRVAKRIVEISLQFRAAFGDEQMMTRIRPVLAWQMDNGQDTAQQQLDFVQKYYGSSQFGYPNPRPVDDFLWCGGGALYYDDVNVAADLPFQQAVRTDVGFATAYGLHSCHYEGGMSFDGDNDPDWHLPQVTDWMVEHQEFLEEHGGELLMYFTLAATWENGLGHVHTVRNLATPKYQGLLQIASGTRRDNVYGAALPMHRNGGDFHLARPSWKQPAPWYRTIEPLEWRAYLFDVDQPGVYRVWVDYSATQATGGRIFVGSELLDRISSSTGGSPQATPHREVVLPAGLAALRLENWGSSAFDAVAVHVEPVATGSNFLFADNFETGTTQRWSSRVGGP